MKILFKYPTRGRPEWFKQTLEKYYNLMSVEFPFQFIITMDLNDPTMNNPQMKQYLDSKKNLKYYYGNHSSKIAAVNDNLKGVDFDILVLVSDDMEPVVKNYDQIIVETMLHYFPDTDGALHFNDGLYGKDKTITLSILGRKMYERFGYIYHPSYKSEWCDNEFTDEVYALGKVFYSPAVIIKHNWGGGRAKDETYIRNNALKVGDRANYEKRKKLNFPKE